jgi:hypothetical protein|tara:strand:+ start:547 stop:1002 length:456 start_codon:yes stop_codon:yes gene_type:complete
MKTYITKIEQVIPHFNTVNTNVSNRGVDWHLDHILRVMASVTSQLKQSNPDDYVKTFNFKRELIFLTKKIPKGRVQAPKHVNTLTEIDKNEVKSLLEKAKENEISFSTIPKNAYFNHPFFGHLNRNQTKRFLQVHTHHHLNIINDIIKTDS